LKGLASKKRSIAFHHGLDGAKLVGDPLMPRQSIRSGEEPLLPMDWAKSSLDSLTPPPPRPAEREKNSKSATQIHGQKKRALLKEVTGGRTCDACSHHRSRSPPEIHHREQQIWLQEN
jgi:hypothetical protein